MRIRKVEVLDMLKLLDMLYHNGIDYIDIFCEQGEEEDEDSISVWFDEKYINEEYVEKYRENIKKFEEEANKESNIKVNLSDEDLNELL